MSGTGATTNPTGAKGGGGGGMKNNSVNNSVSNNNSKSGSSSNNNNNNNNNNSNGSSAAINTNTTSSTPNSHNNNNSSSNNNHHNNSNSSNNNSNSSMLDRPGDWQIGSKMKLIGNSGEVYEGILFCFDPWLGVITLTDKDENHETHFSLVQVKSLKSAQVLTTPSKSTSSDQMPLPNIDLEDVKKRENDAFQRAEASLSRIGKNVTPEAQTLFDQLSKTQECIWQGASIVDVKLKITIDPPYQPENCKGDDKPALERIQKMVSIISERIKNQSSSTTNIN